jgi:SAM-dependent methyltransferase
MNSNYWIDFWINYALESKDMDSQSQVLRTLNKQPISKELWDFTLTNIDEVFKVDKGDYVLDLCSGNGLLAEHFQAKGAHVVAVDISRDLLENIKEFNGIETIISDIREVQFNQNTFDKIVIYAGIQYLNNKEALILMRNMYSWLKPGGVLFIGDIPDHHKIWEFYNNAERQAVYFENVLNDTAIVGNWFEREWFENLTTFIGFKHGEHLKQHHKLIYSNFRFDFRYLK